MGSYHYNREAPYKVYIELDNNFRIKTNPRNFKRQKNPVKII